MGRFALHFLICYKQKSTCLTWTVSKVKAELILLHHLKATHLTCLWWMAELPKKDQRLGNMTKPPLCRVSSESKTEDKGGFHRWATLLLQTALEAIHRSDPVGCFQPTLLPEKALLLLSGCLSRCWLRMFSKDSLESTESSTSQSTIWN